MTNEELRYMELMYRKAIVKEIFKKLEEENKSKTMLMFAKSFDDKIEEKQAGYLIVSQRWIDEIDKELKELEGKVFEEFVEKEVQKAKEKL